MQEISWKWCSFYLLSILMFSLLNCLIIRIFNKYFFNLIILKFMWFDYYFFQVLTGHTGSVLCLQYDDKVIISGSSDSTVRVWNVNTGDMVNTLIHHCEAVLHLRFNNGMMVTCSKVRKYFVSNIYFYNIYFVDLGVVLVEKYIFAHFKFEVKSDVYVFNTFTMKIQLFDVLGKWRLSVL